MFAHLNRTQLEDAYKLLIDDRMYERSKTLIDAHHLKTVVYAVFIMSLDDKSILIKIGSTKNMKERLEKISSRYGVKAAVMDIYPCERHGDFETFVQQSKMMRPIQYTEVVNNRVASIEIFRLERMEDYTRVKSFMKKTVFLYEKCDIREKILQVRDKELNNERTILDILEAVPKDQRVEMIRLMFPTQKVRVEDMELATDTQSESPIGEQLRKEDGLANVENIGDQLDMADDASTSGNLVNEDTVTKTKFLTQSVGVEDTKLATDTLSESPVGEQLQKEDGPADVEADDASTSGQLDLVNEDTATNTIVRIYAPSDLTTVIKEYDSILNAISRYTDYSTTKPAQSSIRTHVRNCTIYCGYRWQTISSLDRDEHTPMLPTADLQLRTSDFIAELSEDQTTIIHPVYTGQGPVAEYAEVCIAAVCRALSKNKKTGGKGLPKKLFKRWNDIDIEIREAYLMNHALPDPPPPARAITIFRIRDGDARAQVFIGYERLRGEERVTARTVQNSAKRGEAAKDGWKYWFPEDDEQP
jgi:hypothetical protein